MSNLLLIAVPSMFFALLLYSLGVWSGRKVASLGPIQLIYLWAGLFFDVLGTGVMAIIAGKIDFDLHGITGIVAIGLMLVNSIWATYAYKGKTLSKYQLFSLVIWVIWLIPFVSGMILAMSNRR